MNINKYQKALERAYICGDNDCCDCKFNEICINDRKGWYGTLKELVDKATPKKPEQFGNNEYCPKCHYLGHRFYKYCPYCGQALDFGDEDD